eukprot:scaffold684_cov345-Pavlova_lutheri.AAC.35
MPRRRGRKLRWSSPRKHVASQIVAGVGRQEQESIAHCTSRTFGAIRCACACERKRAMGHAVK